jgi:hypothetical protein
MISANQQGKISPKVRLQPEPLSGNGAVGTIAEEDEPILKEFLSTEDPGELFRPGAAMSEGWRSGLPLLTLGMNPGPIVVATDHHSTLRTGHFARFVPSRKRPDKGFEGFPVANRQDRNSSRDAPVDL